MIHLRIDGQCFGTAKAEIFQTWNETAERWIFRRFEGGLNHYRAQLPRATKAPVMIFDDLTIETEFKRKGLGSAGMMATMRQFRNQGAKVAFLRIGTQGEDWCTGKIWRQRMFEKLGWKVPENHPTEKGDVPIMWHPMEGELSSSKVEEVTIEIVEDRIFPLVYSYPVNRRTKSDPRP